MRFFCKNTAGGLVPMYDADYEEKRKLKIGKVYSVEIKLERNPEFHRKYFALINCAWEYQNEQIRAAFKENKEGFRKSVEMEAGWYEPIIDISAREIRRTPKSISFASMTAEQFSDLYERVKDVLWKYFLQSVVSQEEFEENLMNF